MHRHARLFELIRQQNRAAGVAARLSPGAELDDAALMMVAQRAAQSWQKLC